MAGPRWKTLPLISNSTGRVGDTRDDHARHLERPGRHLRHHRDDALHQRLRPARRRQRATYTIADSDLGAILRVRETASNVGGETTVWSARYVGPVISAQAAAGGAAAAARRRCATREGSTLALAKLSGRPSRAPARRKARAAKVTLRRAGKVKGKLVAWACPATVTAGATPPPCSAKVTLRKSATLRLPASLAGKVRVTVVRGRS